MISPEDFRAFVGNVADTEKYMKVELEDLISTMLWPRARDVVEWAGSGRFELTHDTNALFTKDIHENADSSKTVDVVAVVHDATTESSIEDNLGNVLTAATWLMAALESIDGDIRFSIAGDDVLNRVTTNKLVLTPTSSEYLIESVVVYETVFGLKRKSKGLGLGEKVDQYVTVHNKDNLQLPPYADLPFIPTKDNMN